MSSNQTSTNAAGRPVGAIARLSLPALCAQLIWGFNVVALKYAVGEIDTYIAGFLRVFLAGLILLIALKRQEGRIGVARHHWPRLLLVGAVGMGINTVCWQSGLARSTATNAALLTNASPIFALILAVALGQERLIRRRGVGMLVALAGAGLVVGTNGLDFGAASALGNLMLIGAVTCWAAYNVLGVPLLRSLSPLRVTAWAMLTAATTMAIFSPWGVRNWDVSHVSLLAWCGLAYAILLGTVVGTTLWSRAVQTIGASATMVYGYLSPILSVGFAALLLGETIQPMQIAGALLVVAGVTISQGRRVRV